MRSRDDKKASTGHPPDSPDVTRKTTGGAPPPGRVLSDQTLDVVDAPEGFPIPHEVLRRSNISVFRVRGNCVGDDVHDGDYVIAERFRVPEEGDLVVTAIARGERRLRRFQSDTRGVRLEAVHPSNRAMATEEQNVDIQGVVVGILRKYTS
jgi:repressor LexA